MSFLELDFSKIVAFLLVAVGLNFYLKNFLMSLGVSLVIFYFFLKRNRKALKYLFTFLILISIIKFFLLLFPLMLILAGIGLYFLQRIKNFFF